jgi:methylated-DNA-protein-cysteine methyltransferase related protein
MRREPEGFRAAAAAVIGSLRRGEVASYGEIALRAGFPGAARAVGTLLATSCDGLPWWRVVRSDGRLASSSPTRQARLLAKEGVAVERGRIADPTVRRRLRPDYAAGPPQGRSGRAEHVRPPVRCDKPPPAGSG